MTVRRLAAALLVGLVVQGSVFAWRYEDLIYLRRPVAALLGGGRDRFVRHASRALERPTLTRAHLDTIAEAAQGFGLIHFEVTARERRVALDPADRAIKLRFAEALRRQGDRVRAERQFKQLVEAAP
jgi:hypothetical protein